MNIPGQELAEYATAAFSPLKAEQAPSRLNRAAAFISETSLTSSHLSP